MKHFTFYRNNSHFGGGFNVKIFVNDLAHDLPNQSSFTITTNEKSIEIQAKYLWFRSKKIKIETESKKVKIRVNQLINDKFFFLSIAIIFFLFIFNSFIENDILQNIFFIYSLTFFSLIFSAMTICSRFYFNFNINEEGI
jgi:hypothetical protein